MQIEMNKTDVKKISEVACAVFVWLRWTIAVTIIAAILAAFGWNFAS